MMGNIKNPTPTTSKIASALFLTVTFLVLFASILSTFNTHTPNAIQLQDSVVFSSSSSYSFEEIGIGLLIEENATETLVLNSSELTNETIETSEPLAEDVQVTNESDPDFSLNETEALVDEPEIQESETEVSIPLPEEEATSELAEDSEETQASNESVGIIAEPVLEPEVNESLIEEEFVEAENGTTDAEVPTLDDSSNALTAQIVVDSTPISSAAVPTISSLTLSTTNESLNNSEQNLTASWTVSDGDGDSVRNITNWYLNGSSITVLNFYFDQINGTSSNNAHDYSSFANDGTEDGPGYFSSGGHDNGGYYSFDEDKAIDVSDSSTLDTGLGDTVSVEAWVYFNSLTNDDIIITKGDSNGIISYALQLDSAAQNLQWIVNTTTEQRIASSEGLTTNQWIHYVGTYDGTTMSLYVNGTLQNTTAQSGNIADSSYGLTIGFSPSRGGSSGLFGRVDDVRVYNRSLSAKQVSALYADDIGTLVSQETNEGDNWTFWIQGNDGGQDSISYTSSQMIIDTVPSVSNVIINTSLTDLNTTGENITAHFTVTGDPGERVSNVTNWYKNDSSLSQLFFTFNGVDNQTGLNGKDYSGYGNDLVATGGTPTWSTSGGRDGFGAYQLDEGDYLNVSVGDSLNEPTTNLTIAVWVNATASSFISDYQGIVSKRSSSTNHYSLVLGPFGSIASQVCFETVPVGGGNRGACSGSNIDLNEWVHIAVTVAKPNLTFYVNGQKNSSVSYDYTMLNNGEELLLGTSSLGSGQNYAGWIDDVFISNSTLTGEQINVMYNERHDLIPLEATEEGEQWYVNITPNDNKRDGESVVSDSLVITAANTAPTLTGLSVSPQDPLPTQNLSAQVTFLDAVGQTGTVTWEWLINGSVVHSQVNNSLAGGAEINVSSSLDANNLSASDMVSVQVNATDGYLTSSTTSSTINVANYSSISITLDFNQSSYETGSITELTGFANDSVGSYIVNTSVGVFRDGIALTPSSWADSSYSYRQKVNLSEQDSTVRTSEGVVLNFTGLSSRISSCTTDMRIYNQETSTLIPFNVLSDTQVGNDRRCEILTEVNLSADSSIEYAAYYGSTSTPTDPGYSTFSLNRTRNDTSIASSGTASACYSHFVVGRINDDDEGTFDDSFNGCAEAPEWWAINWSSQQNITSIQFYENAFGDGWIDDDPAYYVDYWNGSAYVNVTNILRDPSTTAGSNVDAYYNTYFNPISTESIRLRPYSAGGNTFTGLWELYVYQPLELAKSYSSEESLPFTNDLGTYALNVTMPSTPGVYEFKANISQSVFSAQGAVNITVYQIPTINSSALNATPYYEGNFQIQAVIDDDNINTVGFEVYSPSGSVALSDSNGTTDDSINWNSSNFTISEASNYSYKVIATDVDGNQVNSSKTRIDFITTSLNLDPSLVNISQNFSAYGYSNFTNGSNVELVVVSVFLNGTQQSPSETWFNNSWSYRVPITISEDGGNTVSDTSVSLTLDTQTLISNNKMNSDCSDLRISDYNGTEMNYWIQNASSCNSSSTLIWVPLNLTASTNTTIYAYYGNVDASSTSNSSLVMQFTEDFESYTDKNDMTGSAWADIGINDANIDLSSSAAYDGSYGLLLDPSDGAGWDKASTYYNVSTFSKGTVIEWYAFEGDDNHYGGITGFTDDVSQSTGCPVDRGTDAVGMDGTCSNGGGNDAFVTISGTSPTVVSANYDRQGWKQYRLVWDDTSSFWVNGVQLINSSTNIPDADLYFRFSCFPYGTVNSEPDKYCYYDEIVAYSNFTETSSSVGTEETGWFTNGTGDYNVTLIAPASNDQVPVLTRVVSKGFTGQASSTLLIGLSSDPTTDNSNLSVSSTTPREQEVVTINTTVYNIGTDVAASLDVGLYVDGVANESTTLTNLANGSSELVQFNWSAEFGNHSLEVKVDPSGLITELIETNNNASTDVVVSRVVALNYTGPTADFSRGADNTGEDSLGEVSGTQELSSRVYSLYNDSLGILANCSFYLDGSLIGTNETNANGNCVYGLDKSSYDFGEYNFFVNFTDIPTQTVQHTTNISDSRTLGVRVFNITTSTDNFYDGVGYVIGEMSVVNITVYQNNTLFDPETLSIDLRGSAGGNPSSPGDLTQLSAGQYQFAALVNDTPAGGFLRWHIRVNESSQTIATAINQDVEISSATATLNASVINASLDLQDSVNFTLQDAGNYVLDSRIVSSSNQEASNVRQNKNHSFTLQTTESETISFQLVELNESNNSVQAQIVADPSSESASNVSNLTQIVGFESFEYSFVNATIALPLPSSGRNLSNIQYCSQWNETAANCSSSWVDSGLGFTNNGTHFSFTVSNFSAYAGGIGFNSELVLWDETDSSSFLFAGQTKNPSDTVGFFANYTNLSSSEAISSSCTISFDESPSGPFAMTYNSSSQLHEYERTFSAQGSSNWDVSCSNANFDDLSETDSVTITAASSSSSGSSSSDDSGAASAGGSGGGGGGGGGSAVNPNKAVLSEVKVIESVGAGTVSKISDLSNEVIKEFEFTFTEDQSAVLVEVKSVAQSSTELTNNEILLPRRPIYHVARISAYNIEYSEIERAIIEFEVERSWLDERSLDPQQVSMYRNVAGVWYELPTRPAGQRNGVISYEARTPGFSYFIIAQNDLSPDELEQSISEQLEFAESPLQIEVLNELSIVQSLILSALEEGADVSAAQAEVDQAVAAYESGNYDLAKEIAVRVHEQMDLLLDEVARAKAVQKQEVHVPRFLKTVHTYALRYQVYWLAAIPLLLFLIFSLRIALHIRKEKREEMLKQQEKELRKQEAQEKRQRERRKKARVQKKKAGKTVSKKRRKK